MSTERKSGAIVWILLFMLVLWGMAFWFWPRATGVVTLGLVIGVLLIANYATGRARNGRL